MLVGTHVEVVVRDELAGRLHARQHTGRVLAAGVLVDDDRGEQHVADCAGPHPSGDADHHDVVDSHGVEQPLGGAPGPLGTHPRLHRHNGVRAHRAGVHLGTLQPDLAQAERLHDRPQLRWHRRQQADERRLVVLHTRIMPRG